MSKTRVRKTTAAATATAKKTTTAKAAASKAAAPAKGGATKKAAAPAAKKATAAKTTTAKKAAAESTRKRWQAGEVFRTFKARSTGATIQMLRIELSKGADKGSLGWQARCVTHHVSSDEHKTRQPVVMLKARPEQFCGKCKEIASGKADRVESNGASKTAASKSTTSKATASKSATSKATSTRKATPPSDSKSRARKTTARKR